MVHQTISYLGELRCEAIHGPSSIKLMTDAPVDNHGKGESFSPTDLVVTALATCIITTIGMIAERERIELSGTKIYAEKHMTVAAPRRIDKIVLRFTMLEGIPVDFRQKIKNAVETCPVKRSLHPDVKIESEFIFPD